MTSFRLHAVTLLAAFLTVGFGTSAHAQNDEPTLPPDVPSVKDTANYELIYVPTPTHVAEQMFELADITARDTVYDLGSGDGRLVIQAAKEYGAYGVGIELDHELVIEARKKARDAGVADRVEFREKDFFTADISDATVLLLYLLPDKLEKLQPKLVNELEPGTPIVTHDFMFEAWEPEKQIRLNTDASGWTQRKTIYLWRVPEQQ